MARTKKDIRIELEKAVVDYNTAMFEDKPDTAADIAAHIDELVDEHNKIARNEVFDSFDGDLTEAIKTRFYPAVRFKIETDLETQTVSGKISDLEKEFALESLEKYYHDSKKVQLMADPLWKFALQRFGQLMTLRTINALYEDESKKEIAIKNCKSSYYLSKKAAALKCGGNPTSNTKVIKELQSIVDMVLYSEKEFVNKSGETIKCNSYTVTKEDIAFIDRVFCRENTSKSKIGVKTVTNAGMSKIFRHVMWKLVTGIGYETEYKVAKEK